MPYAKINHLGGGFYICSLVCVGHWFDRSSIRRFVSRHTLAAIVLLPSLCFRQLNDKIHGDMSPMLVRDLKGIKQSVVSISRRLCFSAGIAVSEKLFNHLVHVRPVVRLLKVE